MMNKLFWIIQVLIFVSCNVQKNKIDTKQNDKVSSMIVGKIERSDNFTFLERYLMKYFDSLNTTNNENDIPRFLNDSQFDYNNKGVWDSFHNPVSVRAQIINRVNNCRILQTVALSKNKNFRKKPKVEDDLKPTFIELSFYDYFGAESLYSDASQPMSGQQSFQPSLIYRPTRRTTGNYYNRRVPFRKTCECRNSLHS